MCFVLFIVGYILEMKEIPIRGFKKNIESLMAMCALF